MDTSTFRGSIGWVRLSDSEHSVIVDDFARMSLPAKPGHAERLLERVDLLLESGGFTLKDVGLIVFGRGPGTFTGLRIGMSTAKAFAVSLNIPVVGMSTLEMIALSSGAQGVVIPLIDARRGELYAGAFEVTRKDGAATSRSLMPECVVRADQLADVLSRNSLSRNSLSRNSIEDDRILVGDGVPPYREALASIGRFAPYLNAATDPCWMAMHGLERFRADGPDNLATVEPSYLREPDAKLPSAKKK